MKCFLYLRQTLPLVVFVLAITLTSIHAAETTATISGTVQDSSGAVIANAPVTLTNVGTNISKSIRTGTDGSYLFTLVPIGTYQLTVQQAGFRKYVRDGIVLNVNQNAKVNIALAIGTTDQVVEVNSDVTQVDTLSATLGSVETERRINDLPLVERDTFQLGLLQAGVFPPDDDDGSGNPFSVSGQRSESVSFMIDGTDNNDFLGNNAVVNPNPDAVGEFKILTNNYSAEFGRTSGGIVNQVIKSGTNKFHGDLFEFIRNDAFNARNYFLPAVTPYKRNTFGATLGGPIRKDKTFFFVAYQGLRRHEGQAAPVLQVLSPAERSGDFSELLPSTQLVNPIDGSNYVNNQVPVNPVIANYIAKYLPLPNLPNNNFVSSPTEIDREDQGVARIDHQIGSKDSINASYIIDDLSQNTPFTIVNGGSTGGNVPIGSGSDNFFRSQLLSITWLHTFSPRVVNEFVFGANRSASTTAIPHDTTSPSALGFTNVNPDDPAGTAPPIMLTTSFNLGPNPQGPTKIHDATFHFQDSLSITKGRHDIKFGADIRRVRNNLDFDFDNNGVYDFGNDQNFTGSPLADFVGGFYDNFSQYSAAVYGIRTTQWNFFGQDAWKVFPRLTLDLGLRYEYNSPLIDPHNEIQGYFPGRQSTRFPSAPPGILYAGDPNTPNAGLTYPDRNNFAPRIGFAWDMMGNAKLVMRGGFGIFYDIEDGALNEQFGGEAPFGHVINILPSGFGNIPGGVDTIADPYGSFSQINPFPTGGMQGSTFGVPKVSLAYVVDPHFRTPYSENVNYGFQYQVTRDTVIEADYVASFSRKSVVTTDLNAPLPSILQQQNANGFLNPECARPLAACANATTDPNALPTGVQYLYTDLSAGNSNSNQLQFTVDKRFSQGFNVRGAYTLSKTIDDQSGFRYNSSVYTDPFDHSFDRGPANFDVRHRAVISGIWDLPLDRPFRNGHTIARKISEGWEASGIISYQTGTPFTIFSNSNSSQSDEFFDRADSVPGHPNQIFSPRSLHSFTDTNAANCLGAPITNGHFYFDPTAYDCANVPLFTYGNSGRNIIYGPGRNNYDLTIGRHFKFSESKNLEFRAEFFNAFNHAQFNNPDHNGFDANFAQITQARDPRLIQFALKFYF
jgi:outer membrane receptor protein involved in Fe transport